MKLRPSLILHTSVVFLFPVGLLFSVYLLFAGHNAPGGGFIGGLVAGAAYALRFLDEGLGDDGSPMPVTPEILMGVGLVIAVAV
ncbi:MAG: MnhB domain-containing protein, partial [Acidimicrobiia bacterium]|nr:MnhB domain-containing protein [Acidimicrobiia bacterium]